MVKISVITSVYNTSVSYLEEYVQSLLNQTYQDFEVVLVDDGSTEPDTLTYLHEIKKKYPDKFHVHFMDSNKGICVCRNWGLIHALGEYVCILDSDDYYSENYLQEMVRPVLQDITIDMVVDRGFTKVTDKGKSIAKMSSSGKDANTYISMMIPTGSRLFQKKLLLDNNVLFPESVIYEDNAFFVCATLYAQKVTYIDNYGYINRVHQASFSHNNNYKKLIPEKIPFEYLYEKIYSTKLIANCEKGKREAAQGSILVMLATCACIFDRNSLTDEKRQINIETTNFVKRNIKSYLKCMLLWMRKGTKNYRENFIFLVFYVSMLFGLTIQYTQLIHTMLNKIIIREE